MIKSHPAHAFFVRVFLLVALVPVTVGLLAPGTLLAQTGPQETMGQVRETLPAAPFLASAYAFIWVALVVYVVFVARRLTRVQAEIADVRRRLERESAAKS
jgi:CcmD family protein